MLKKNLFKALLFLFLLGILLSYLNNEKKKFSKNKVEATQKIVENLNIRHENFFEDNEYVKKHKTKEPLNVNKSKKEAITKQVKDIITNKRYVLQIATYSIKENAVEMQAKLKPIDNFLIESSKINQDYYIVVSREFYSRNEVEALEMKVNDKFTNLKPLIKLRYSDGKSSKH